MFKRLCYEIYESINAKLAYAIKNNYLDFYDEEFFAHHENHIDILLVYTAIKDNRNKFEAYGLNYKTESYGINNSYKTPVLYNNEYIILFFSQKNKLTSNYITEKIKSDKKIIIIQFRIEESVLDLKFKINKDNKFKDMVINYEK